MIRLASASLSFDGFADTDFVATFELAPQIGFRFVEFNCWYPRNISAAGVRSIRRRCESTGFTAGSVYFGHVDGADRHELSQSLAYGMRGVDTAAELGCTTFVTLGGPRASGLDAVLSTLDHLVPYAEEVGITIGLENHDGNAIQTLEDYETILDRFDSSHVGICADIGHFHASGVATNDVVSRFSDRVVHIHVKDNAEFGRKQFVPFGTGTADNIGFVQSMADRGYDGMVVVELSPTSLDFTDRTAHFEALSVAYNMFHSLTM